MQHLLDEEKTSDSLDIIPEVNDFASAAPPQDTIIDLLNVTFLEYVTDDNGDATLTIPDNGGVALQNRIVPDPAFEALKQEHAQALETIKKLENDSSKFKRKLLQLENQLSTGINKHK